MIHTQHKFLHVLVGLVLILFSLSFFITRFEKDFDKLEETQIMLQEKKVRYDYIIRDSGAKKLAINELNAEVGQMASDISQLVLLGNNLNDTIIKFMDEARASRETLDTLAVLQDSLANGEQKVDSLNRLFEEKSDKLIQLVNEYESAEVNTNLIKSEIQINSERIWFIKLFLLIYLFFIVIGLISGIFLLIQGLK